jgi:hypothetical protein
MTGGGDTDEVEDQTFDESDDVADEDDDVDVDEDDELHINENDPDPTAGASDIGGRAGDDEGPADP